MKAKTQVVNLNMRIGGNSYIYIGRPSTWGNPFQVGRDGTRAEVIRYHLEWLYGKREAPDKSKPPTIGDIKKYLSRKRLGCFCHPLPCHGDNYVKICEEENDS